MAALVPLGLALGLDNARVSLTLGTTGVSMRSAVRFSAAFAAFEMVMPLVGAVVGQSLNPRIEPWAEALGAATLLIVGAYVILLGAQDRKDDGVLERNWIVLGLPMSLSIDNLVAGFGLGLLDYPVLVSAVVLGLISGACCVMGFCVGRQFGHLLARPAQVVAGLTLVGMSVSNHL